MPLAHQPHKPVPEVELLGTPLRITVQDAIEGMRKAVEVAGGTRVSVTEFVDTGPGSGAVNYKHLPSILESLVTDWAPLQIAERPAECFAEVRGRLETHMHPHFMGSKLKVGLRSAAGNLLLRYIPALGCVPMGFTHLSPVGTQAALVGESPYLHFLLEFHAVAFFPEVGQWLVGRISQDQTRLGINIQVLNCVHFSVSWESLHDQFWYDDVKGRWHRCRSDTGNELGDPVDHNCPPVWVRVKRLKRASGKGAFISLDGDMDWPPDGAAGSAGSAAASSSAATASSTVPAAASSSVTATADAADDDVGLPSAGVGKKTARRSKEVAGPAAAAAANGGAVPPKKRKKGAAGAFGKRAA